MGGNLPEFLCFLCSASTTQQRTAQRHQPAQAAQQVRADQKATTQASRQELARASMPSSISAARCVLKTNEEIEICPAYNMQPFTKQLSWCACTLLFLSVLSISSIHASGLLSWTMELLGICKPPTLYLKTWISVRFNSFAFRSILPCE